MIFDILPVKLVVSGSVLRFLLDRIWLLGVLLRVPFGPGVVRLRLCLGLGPSCGVPGCQQQLKDASQLAGLELGRNGVGAPAAA